MNATRLPSGAPHEPGGLSTAAAATAPAATYPSATVPKVAEAKVAEAKEEEDEADCDEHSLHIIILSLIFIHSSLNSLSFALTWPELVPVPAPAPVPERSPTADTPTVDTANTATARQGWLAPVPEGENLPGPANRALRCPRR